MVKKNERLLILAEVHIVLGPQENRMIIPAFRIRGTRIQLVVNVCKLVGIHVSVSLRNSRVLGIQIFNANHEAKIISQKMCSARVLLYTGVEVQWDKKCVEELLIEINRMDLEEWGGRYPSLFEETGQYGKNEFLRKLQACHKEIDWKIKPQDILKASTRVTYNISEVGDKEPMNFVMKLEREVIVSQLQVVEKAFFSLIMFLRKARQKGVLIVDFRLLKAYSKNWKSHFLGTLATVRMVLSH